jgi:tetratricopeptide (TPR) repeat protein
MIVKDEAEVISRSLGQLIQLIDYWVIVDTGSSDETCEIIERVLAGVPGELHRRPWKNFGHNRSEAIELARGKADYLLFFDADDLLLSAPGFRWPHLSADAYCATFVGGDIRYERVALVSNRLPWRFEGVLHEYPTPDCDHSVLSLPELVIESRRDGGRSKEGQAVKYARDAEVLAEALQLDPHNTRNVFYLATSLRDAGQLEQAMEAFERRAAMGGWDQEVWYSRLQIAALKELLDRPVADVIYAYLSAHEARPARAESLGMLCRYLRSKGNHWELASLFAARAIQIPLSDDILFVDRSWYDWRCLDEFAVAAYWAGKYQESLQACERLLASAVLPDAQRERVNENLNYARSKLG